VPERASAPTESVSGAHVIRVAVVDDEALVRSEFSLILGTAADIEVVATATGGDAVAAVREHRPDVALLDIRMPDVNGLTILQQLLALPAPPVGDAHHLRRRRVRPGRPQRRRSRLPAQGPRPTGPTGTHAGRRWGGDVPEGVPGPCGAPIRVQNLLSSTRRRPASSC
jgi:hypothetical protein